LPSTDAPDFAQPLAALAIQAPVTVSSTVVLSVSYGVSLPGTPTDGTLFVLVDSATNPSYQFQFRYNANSSTSYKWECIGAGGALEGTTAITIPNAGDWYVEIGDAGRNLGTSSESITLTAGGISLAAEGGAAGGGTESILGSFFDRGRMKGLTAAQVLTPSVSGSPTRQYIRAIPVRIS